MRTRHTRFGNFVEKDETTSSVVWGTNFTSIKKLKEICFLLEVNRFAASFRLVDHIGENHASAQFWIPPM